MKNSAIILTLLYVVLSCGGRKTSSTTPATDVVTPEFCADSAYNYIKAQTDFGPRVPNTDAQQNCAAWLMTKLKEFGAETFLQGFETVTFDKTRIRGYNIIGSYNPESPTRIILCSHWDSRPWADNDPDPANWMKPVDAANDGASGVGVLLEIARQLQAQPTDIGVDIIFFDAEDYGTPAWHRGSYKAHDWCLGSQYWGRTPHVQGYFARYGILLDMVGGKGGTFYYEPYSYRTARKEVKKIWNKAHELGYGSYFVKQEGSEVTDDHVYVNQLARIPCVDIINYDPVYENSSFGPTWHTVNDNIHNIDRNTLKAVGQTVMDVIYNEK